MRTIENVQDLARICVAGPCRSESSRHYQFCNNWKSPPFDALENMLHESFICTVVQHSAAVGVSLDEEGVSLWGLCDYAENGETEKFNMLYPFTEADWWRAIDDSEQRGWSRLLRECLFNPDSIKNMETDEVERTYWKLYCRRGV